MTDTQSEGASHRIDWLTPDPFSGIQMVYTADNNSPWHVTPHWAMVNGRAIMVGLDIRSFDEEYVGDQRDPDGFEDRRPAHRHGLQEITQKVLRGISISRIRDESCQHLVNQMAQHADAIGAVAPDTPVAEALTDAVTSLTTKGQPRKRQPAATEDLLRRVAVLYMSAITSGNKAPSRYVEEQLRCEGAPVSVRGGRDQVRKWIQRARQHSLLPPVQSR